MEDSTETLTDEAEALTPALVPGRTECGGQEEEEEEVPPEPQALHRPPIPPALPQKDGEEGRPEVVHGELVPLREQAVAVMAPPMDGVQSAARRLISQSQLADLSVLGSHWESVQGLVQSACSSASPSSLCRALQPTAYQSRRLASKLLHAQGLTSSANGGPCCRRPGSPVQTGWLSTIKNTGYTAICGPAAAPAPSSSSSAAAGRQLPPVCHSSPSSSGSPAPPPAYLDDDGLPVPMDAVQQRLRQIEASYKQEVEVLRRQVRQLQMRLESKQYSTPPSEPDVDYEDDITCLRESDDSDEEDSLSDRSEDRFSQGSWDRVEQRDTEVTRWVPDHMASHCFNCDSEFWMAKRRHHCRNCGNVFCKDCCHLKQPIPEQQLYDPVLVCNPCNDLLLEARTRDLRSQQLKKPIATASS